jgi:hypothetical protein
MMNRFLRHAAIATIAIALSAGNGRAQVQRYDPSAVRAGYSLTTPVSRRSIVLQLIRARVEDSVARPSRRAAIAGAAAGAVVGGLAAAGYILNATARDCVTSGPPCPKKNYVLLHTVTIAAGASAGAFIGARIGRWVGRRF